mgnify:CR=1 FL=1
MNWFACLRGKSTSLIKVDLKVRLINKLEQTSNSQKCLRLKKMWRSMKNHRYMNSLLEGFIPHIDHDELIELIDLLVGIWNLESTDFKKKTQYRLHGTIFNGVDEDFFTISRLISIERMMSSRLVSFLWNDLTSWLNESYLCVVSRFPQQRYGQEEFKFYGLKTRIFNGNLYMKIADEDDDVRKPQ